MENNKIEELYNFDKIKQQLKGTIKEKVDTELNKLVGHCFASGVGSCAGFFIIVSNWPSFWGFFFGLIVMGISGILLAISGLKTVYLMKLMFGEDGNN